ncbi:hypothetical protein N7495_003861 [Penicillium taxi]|uniref:uncharacterized protein n=1 Tax=Penicillium taxi TaxID=168475 RepID=UPI00254562B0|nr:uncharacterized protein N7495_003861 [Penicillium taxi]KAJ5899117.1 hypothetical protein N7495_003861 [Penicillium taxi]
MNVVRLQNQPSLKSTSHEPENSAQTLAESQPTDADDKPEPDVPPDGGYGWVCVACVFWINAHTWGINSSYGVFLSYYLSHNAFPHTTALAYAFIGGLSISCNLLVGPLANYFTHSYGTKFTLNLGVFLQTLSLIGASFATQEWQLFLSQGVCFGWGMGFLFVGSVSIVPQWFQKRRSVAMGITAAGSGIGGLIFSLSIGAIIPRLGLAWAFRILGITSCVVNLVCANLIRDRNKLIGSRLAVFDFPLLCRPEFLLFLGWGILSMLGYVALVFSVSSYAVSIGLTSHQGSIVAAILNLGQGIGRPLVGMCSDKAGRINTAALATFFCGLWCLVIWVFADNVGVVCFFSVFVGLFAGTYWATVSPVLAEIVGMKDMPSGLSVNWVFLVAPCTVAEVIALKLRSTTASGGTSYLRIQIFTGFMFVGASLCLWLVRSWKIGELERAQQQQSSLALGGPLTVDTDEGNKEDNPNILSSASSTTVTDDVKVWAPFSLARRMVALKRV